MGIYANTMKGRTGVHHNTRCSRCGITAAKASKLQPTPTGINHPEYCVSLSFYKVVAATLEFQSHTCVPSATEKQNSKAPCEQWITTLKNTEKSTCEKAITIMTLHPYQIPQRDLALTALTTGRIFIDTSTTGSGKTYIALSVAETLPRPLHTLVVAPKASHTQWARVASTTSVNLLGITNPESLIRSRSNPFYNPSSRLWTLPSDPVLVIFDEIHRGASGIDSLTTEAVARLKAYPNVRLYAMSATLAETPLKMRATGYWLGLHNFNTPSFHDFCLRHGCTWEMVPNLENRLLSAQGSRTKQRLVFTKNKDLATTAIQAIKSEALSRLHGLTVADIPNFPTQMIEIVMLDLDTRDRKELDDAYASMSERLKSNAKSELAQTTRDRERIEFIKARYMAEEANKLREDGFAVPIFVNFTSVRERLIPFLTPPPSPHSIPQIYGGQSPEDRQQGMDNFQANLPHANCIVVMAQAGGISLNLHDVKQTKPRVSITSPSFSASELLQIFGRIRRDGGTHAIQRLIIAANTVEERIATNLERKLDNLDTLNDSDLNPFSKEHTCKS